MRLKNDSQGALDGTAAAPMAQVLLTLEPADLAEVLGAASDVVRAKLEKLDRGAWKSFRKNMQRHAPVEPALLRRIVLAVRKDQDLCWTILSCWWGRNIEHFVADRGLCSRVRAQKLSHRICFVCNAQCAGDEEIKTVIERIVANLCTSKRTLDLLFVAFIEANRNKEATSDDIANHILSFLKEGPVRCETPPTDIPPSTTPEDNDATAVAPTSERHPPPPDTPNTPSSSDVAPIGGSAPAAFFTARTSQEPSLLEEEWETLERSIAELNQLLKECHAIVVRINELNARGLFRELAAHAERAATLQADFRERYEGLTPSPTSMSVGLPEVPESIFSSQEDASRFVGDVERVLREVKLAERRRIEGLRAELERNFDAVGVERPPELEVATSEEELSSIQRTWAERLRAERVYRALVEREPGAEVKLAGLPPATRVDQFRRLAHNVTRPRTPQEILKLFVRDPDAARACPEQAEALFAELASLVLEAEKPLPEGTWDLPRALTKGSITPLLLRNSNLLDSLALVDTHLWQPEALLAAVGDDRADLPVDVRRELDRRDIEGRPAGHRIKPLARLALDNPKDSQTLGLLVESLLEEKQDRLALLLAVIAHRSGALDTLPSGLHESLLLTLVECALDDGQWNDLVGSIVGEGDWLSESPEDVAVLLFVVDALSLSHVYDYLRYARRAELDKARLARPALVGRWLLARLDGDESGVDREETLENARQALEKWDHELKKNSVYEPWYHASRYQQVFNKALKDGFDQIDAGGDPPFISPQDLIQEGVSNGIPRAQEPCLGQMIRYVEQQVNRLEIFHQARQLLDEPLREGLVRKETPIHHALAAESKLSSNTHRALARIYEYALGGES